MYVLSKIAIASVLCASLTVAGCVTETGPASDETVTVTPEDLGDLEGKADLGVTTVIAIAVGLYIGTNAVYCLLDWFTQSGFWGCSAGAEEAPGVEFAPGTYQLGFETEEEAAAFLDGAAAEAAAQGLRIERDASGVYHVVPR